MDNFRDSYFPVTWDLTKKHLRGTFWGKQYDTGRGFAVTIVEGGQVTVPSNETVRLKWEKPDSTEGYVTAVVVDDKFIIENIDQMFTVHGAVRSDLEVWRGGKVISSITFYVSVEKAVAVDAIESSSQFTALQEALADVGDMQAQVDAVIANATVDSEVILARGTEPTLGARLDADKAEVSAQLAEIVTGTGINDGAISPEKTSFFKSGKNLFNKNRAFLNTTISSTTGIQSSYPNRFATDYIPVQSSADYTKSQFGFTLTFYDSNKVFISGTSEGAKTFKTPLSAKYLRFVSDMALIDTLQIEAGVLQTTYDSYTQKIPLELQEQKLITTNDIENGAVQPLSTSFFTVGKNLFDKSKAVFGRSVSSTTGGLSVVEDRFTTDFIKIKPLTQYTRNPNEYTVAFYDINKTFVSGIATGTGVQTFATPENAAYLRASFGVLSIDATQIEEGSERTPYEDFRYIIAKNHIDNSGLEALGEHKFVSSFETVKYGNTLNTMSNSNASLSLIGLKQIQIGTNQPDTIGYLYLNMAEQKLYYSPNKPDNPNYLCDWNLELAGNIPCEKYICTITNDGDLIFLRYQINENPIIYPSNDYTQPKRIIMTDGILPKSFLNNTGCAVSPSDDYFCFGEYPPHSLAGELANHRRYIWKVSKPYDNPVNWVRVKDFKHVYYGSAPSNEPDNEIGHIHTLIRDHVTNIYYATTGDINRHCRIWKSSDECNTWTEVVSGSQTWRNLGMVFTDYAAWWGNDSHRSAHALYYVPRNEITKEVDFSLVEQITPLDDTYYSTPLTQPTYATLYLRNPHGFLFLDRAEERSDGLLDLMFYSLEYNKLYNTGTYKASEDFVNLEGQGYTRHGFPVQVATTYQPSNCGFVICGGGSDIRSNSLDILDHTLENYIGNLKITVNQVR